MTEPQALQQKINPPWAGFKIPYFTPDGNVTKDFFRYRFWPESKPSSGWASVAAPSKLRYVQPAGTPPQVYMPPLLPGPWRDVMNEPKIDLCITEGELKSACACANGRITLGLGGVFSWTSRKLKQPLIPILEEFKWKDRRVNLCFDSDAATNTQVQLALSRLALTLNARGAAVFTVVIPPTDNGGKQGLDDFIVTRGVDKFEELIALSTVVEVSFELHRLNTECAVVGGGGAASAVVRLEDGLIMNGNAFSILFRNRTYVEYGVTASGNPAAPKTKQAADSWLAWPPRNTVDGITYAPGAERVTVDNKYNLWQPSPVTPAKGDIGRWEELLARMFTDIEPAHLMWFKRWLAYPLKFPGTKMFHCALIWSHTGGTGKNLLAETMIPLYGERNCVTIKSRHLLSEFNAWAEGKQFVIGDEITLDDKRHTSGELKAMLTNRTIRINRKGIESYEVPDCANYYFTSNDPVAIMLDPGDRRTFVAHVNEAPLGDAYGRAFMRWLNEQGGAQALAWHLTQELDIGDFSPTAPPPDTTAKLELISNSRSEIDSWAAALRLDPDKVLRPHASKFSSNGHGGPYSIYTPEDLLRIYDPDDRKRVSYRALGIALDRAGFEKARYNNGRLGNNRYTFWLIGFPPGKTMMSTEAARIYQQERPAQFQQPGAKGQEKLQ
jgi:Domain of unknown function (DUF3854)/Family of unknown function (DUF5906)